MKVLLLLSVVFAVTHGAAIKSYTLQCARESGISKSALESIANLKAPSSDDQAYKTFIFCLLKQMGIIDAEGELRTDTEGLEKWMSADEAKETVEENVRVCGTQKGKIPADTADLLYRCFLDNDI